MQPEKDDASTAARLGIGENVVWALAYLPPFFFLPLLGQPTAEGRFHARQSFVLLTGVFLFAVVVWLSDVIFGAVLGSLMIVGWYFSLLAKAIHYPVGFAVSLLYVAIIVASAVGAATRQTWRVPVVFGLADRLPFWH